MMEEKAKHIFVSSLIHVIEYSLKSTPLRLIILRNAVNSFNPTDQITYICRQ